jgi:acyl carrier protein
VRLQPRSAIELTSWLRYTGFNRPEGIAARFHACDPRQEVAFSQKSQRFSMSSTFDQVATIIAETCDIPRDTITPESHAIDDLGIDSLDFLDIAFAIDKAFGIKLPLEKWTQEVNDGKATTELVAAKGA